MKCNNNRSLKNKAYSIVELSIVLIIVALLIIGVFSGLSLLKQAKLRSIITDLDTFTSAVSSFRDKYNVFPGDMPNAFDTWGTNCAATAAACNGNGDGHIVHTTATTGVESFLAWKHLQLAGMIQGTYTGSATVAGQADIGINVPSSNIASQAGWGFNYAGSYAPPTSEGQYISVGSFTISNLPIGPVLTPGEAYNIDNKIDDGLPRNGTVFANGISSTTGCYPNNTLTGTYNLSIKDKVCGLRFTIGKY